MGTPPSLLSHSNAMSNNSGDGVKSVRISSEGLLRHVDIEFKSLTGLQIFIIQCVPAFEVGNGNPEALSDAGQRVAMPDSIVQPVLCAAGL